MNVSTPTIVTLSLEVAHTGQLHAAEHKWTVIDMAADWRAVYPPVP